MKKPYIEGTTSMQIIRDGWSRDLRIEQTMKELKAMGHLTNQKFVQMERDKLTEEYRRHAFIPHIHCDICEDSIDYVHLTNTEYKEELSQDWFVICRTCRTYLIKGEKPKWSTQDKKELEQKLL